MQKLSFLQSTNYVIVPHSKSSSFVECGKFHEKLRGVLSRRALSRGSRLLFIQLIIHLVNSCQPQKWQLVPVATRSVAWVCGRSPAETVGSNSAGGVDVRLL